MPGGTRGKMKEHLEGVHRNCEAIKKHCALSQDLIAGKNPQWTGAFEVLIALAQNLDETAQDLYGRA